MEYQYNVIATIGVEFLSTRRLHKFGLEWGRLVWPPPSVAKSGPDAVYAFLEAVKEKSAPLARSRAMFVGGGGSGKTTLKTALLLRGDSAHAILRHLRQEMRERIEFKWDEQSLREWVDTDLARDSEFFSQCRRGKGLTGKRWLTYTAQDVIDVFGGSETETARGVIGKMTAVLCFLNPDAFRTTVTASPASWTWLLDIVESLDRVDDLFGSEPPPANIDYSVLLNLPHVWTEAIELDNTWEEYTLWDFSGQMELYPSHRLFLACETAVHILVVNNSARIDASAQLNHWLSLIRSGMVVGGDKIDARIVLTHH
jgi:hypothetical protein